MGRKTAFSADAAYYLDTRRLHGGGRSRLRTFLRPNSLITGKNTGNFSSMIQPSLDKSRIYVGLGRKLRFPEEPEQGINREWKSLIKAM
jgi:hypothetical protein